MKWISAQDQLPPLNKRIFIYYSADLNNKYIYIGYRRKDGYWWWELEGSGEIYGGDCNPKYPSICDCSSSNIIIKWAPIEPPITE